MDKTFVKGLVAKKPHERSPDWIQCNIAVNCAELSAWLAEQTDEWINLQVCESS